MTQNSVPTDIVRPEDLMQELGIKKDAYYADLNYLGIKPNKDEEGRSYLTQSEVEKIKKLRSYVERNNKRTGFEDNASIVKSNNGELKTQQDNDEIYVEPEEPTANIDVNNLMRSAAELKAREVAMPDIIKRAIADQMTEDDLPEDLKEKVNLVREAANPKFKPTDVASQLLNQWRANKGG